MERRDFLEALHHTSRGLRGYFTAPGRRWLTSIVAGHMEPAVDGRSERLLDIDRIYEVLCYFALLHELRRNVQLIYHPGRGTTGFRLPYGPANKGNFCHFRFTSNGETYDVCNGTAIPVEDPDEPKEHPDISLQSMESLASPDEPGELIAVWDAKHHHHGPLTKPDINQMFFWCSVFRLMPYVSGDILDRVFPDHFKVSGIITNAMGTPPYRRPLLKAGFSIVVNFDGVGSGSAPVPSRVEHIAHAARQSQPEPSPV